MTSDVKRNCSGSWTGRPCFHQPGWCLSVENIVELRKYSTIYIALRIWPRFAFSGERSCTTLRGSSSLKGFPIFSQHLGSLLAARVNLQQHNKRHLVDQGWREEEHGSNSSCSCISLFLCLRPLRGGGRILPTIIPTLDLETFHTTAALTTDSLVVASTNLDGRFKETLSSIYDFEAHHFVGPALRWRHLQGWTPALN